jgi:hypothetical protein
MTSASTTERGVLITAMEDDDTIGEKGIFANAQRTIRRVGWAAPEIIGENLGNLCRNIGTALDQAQVALERYELATIELIVEVNTKGEVRFVGSVGAEIKGGLKLVFERRDKIRHA